MSDQYSPGGKRPVGRPPNPPKEAKLSGQSESPFQSDASLQAGRDYLSGTTPRQEEIMQTRRRREGLGPERNLKLNIPHKDPNFEYRWVNDRPGRIQQLTKQDDWDKAPEVMDGSGLGTVTERAVDSYTGEKAVLLRKPKEFYDADKAEEAKLLDQRDEAMRRGPLPSPEVEGGEKDKFYTPGGRNIVSGR